MQNLIRFFVAGLLVLSCGSWARRVRSSVNPEKAEALKAAAPLNHLVKVTRTGRVLKLDYQLIGSDGKKYNLWDIRDRNKPAFAIYQDGVKVGGGTFEFG